MALLSRRTKTLAPRLAPELDDQALAKACKIIKVPRAEPESSITAWRWSSSCCRRRARATTGARSDSA